MMSNWDRLLSTGGQRGWICPVCGQVNAPWMPYCTGCKRRNETYAVGTGTGSIDRNGVYRDSTTTALPKNLPAGASLHCVM